MRYRLIRAMEKAEITHGMLATKLNVTPTRISQILSGQRMNEDQLRIVSEFVGVPIIDIVYDFMTEDGSPHKFHSKDEWELIERFRLLSPKVRVLIMQLLRETT